MFRDLGLGVALFVVSTLLLSILSGPGTMRRQISPSSWKWLKESGGILLPLSSRTSSATAPGAVTKGLIQAIRCIPDVPDALRGVADDCVKRLQHLQRVEDKNVCAKRPKTSKVTSEAIMTAIQEFFADQARQITVRRNSALALANLTHAPADKQKLIQYAERLGDEYSWTLEYAKLFSAKQSPKNK